MAGTLEVADVSQHRENGLNQHTDVPLAALAKAQIGRMPIHLLESGVRKDDHVVRHVVHQALKSAAIVNIGRITGPTDDEAEMIDKVT